MFFPPASDIKENGKPTTNEGSAQSETQTAQPADNEADKLPDLPDVPTQEPSRRDEPEAKKAKFDHDDK